MFKYIEIKYVGDPDTYRDITFLIFINFNLRNVLNSFRSLMLVYIILIFKKNGIYSTTIFGIFTKLSFYLVNNTYILRKTLLNANGNFNFYLKYMYISNCITVFIF